MLEPTRTGWVYDTIGHMMPQAKIRGQETDVRGSLAPSPNSNKLGGGQSDYTKPSLARAGAGDDLRGCHTREEDNS